MVGTYSYDAYEKQLQSTGGINNNFRYGGKYGYYYDEQVYGMYLAGARWYSPDLYRWMSRDPIEYAGGDNMFAYVAGNPVKYVDPSGLWENPIKYWNDFSRGAEDFLNNYLQTRGANTVGADKFFHCRANCESSQRGLGGENIADIISEFRELVDENINGDTTKDCNEDRAANAQGRSGFPGILSCVEICKSLIPNALSPIYYVPFPPQKSPLH